MGTHVDNVITISGSRTVTRPGSVFARRFPTPTYVSPPAVTPLVHGLHSSYECYENYLYLLKEQEPTRTPDNLESVLRTEACR
jgi:hypothetical protein